MTPREFWRYLAGARKALELQERLSIQAAWYAAAWQRSEKMPSLAKALAPFNKPAEQKQLTKAKPMTPAESRAKMRAAFATMGVIET